MGKYQRYGQKATRKTKFSCIFDRNKKMMFLKVCGYAKNRTMNKYNDLIKLSYLFNSRHRKLSWQKAA